MRTACIRRILAPGNRPDDLAVASIVSASFEVAPAWTARNPNVGSTFVYVTCSSLLSSHSKRGAKTLLDGNIAWTCRRSASVTLQRGAVLRITAKNGCDLNS